MIYIIDFERKLGRSVFAEKFINEKLKDFKLIGNNLEFTFKGKRVRRMIKKDKQGKYINFFEYKVYINNVIK